MADADTNSIKIPSGKDANSENFPVGSWLLPARLRPHVACFYAFARAADDIADNPDLSPDEKIKRLDVFEATLLGGSQNSQKTMWMAASLKQTGITPQHCLDLLAAFRRDAIKSRYDDWLDLMAYCRLSAAPVGRYLIDLHGGSKLGYWPSDSLCAALQLINHLQDCGDDYRTLNRVYLPMDWMAEAGVDAGDLAANKASPALRQVMDWTLDGINALLLDAQTLPGQLYSGRLALESSVIIQIARTLSKRLRQDDPLSGRVELTATQLATCSVKGIISGLIFR